MKRIIPSIIALFISVLAVAQQEKVAVRIEQGSAVYPVNDSAITLYKEPFRIVVTLQHIEGVYCYAGFTDSIYKTPAGEKVNGFEYLPFMAMAEVSFNEDRSLILNREGWAYWFYNPSEDFHRFDKDPVITADSVVGTKTIKELYIYETEKTIPVANISAPLYLFFLTIEKDEKTGNPVKELQRMKTIVNFRD